jgi:hypothetical protein
MSPSVGLGIAVVALALVFLTLLMDYLRDHHAGLLPEVLQPALPRATAVLPSARELESLAWTETAFRLGDAFRELGDPDYAFEFPAPPTPKEERC